MLRSLIGILVLGMAVGASAETSRRSQYLVVLTRSIQKSGLTALGATIDADLDDTLVVTVDDDSVELLRNYPGVRYLQRVITPGQRDDRTPPGAELSAAAAFAAPSSHRATPLSSNWTSGTYLYDASGNVTSIGTANVYWYDKSSRLTHATVASHFQDFTYDGFGNMLSMTTDSQTRQLATSASTNRLNLNTYDVAGNVTIDDMGYHYVYDAFNMIQDKRQGAEIDIYDASDERLGALRGGKWTWTLRDESGKVLREYQSSDTTPSAAALWLGDYVWRDGSLAAAQRVAEEGGTRHFHLDHLGNPRLVTGANGAQIAQHDFYPFGREITPMNPDTTAGMREDAFRFTGHERDWSSGTLSDNTDYLDYMHARYYNPNAGRFLSIDPNMDNDTAYEPQKWNRYSYVTNNPLRYMDPTGETRWDRLNGYFNALVSDAGLTVRRTGNADFKLGQLNGDRAGVTSGFIIATASATGGIITSPTGVGAIAGGVGVVAGSALMINSGIHLAQDESPRSGGSSEKIKTVVEDQDAVKKADKLAGKAKEGYEQIKDILARGLPGKNQHALTGDMKGWYAADLPGSGAGRGATRVIYKVEDNQIIIRDIINYH
jgi:RHS repeat-associated protein